MFIMIYAFGLDLGGFVMKREIVVDVIFDDVEKVYVGTSRDLVGLVVEANSFEGLVVKLNQIVPDLIELRKILKNNGCSFVRQGKGDHEFWESPNGARFPVDDGMKSRHTANAVLKQAGIDYKIS
jgi:predicted RNA binding protein YcfA (HicA-like mRNA interferase family)